MPFFFADQEVLAKQPVPEFSPKQLTVSIKQKMERPVILVNHVSLSTKEHQ
jgi:hypothetical protein